MTDPKYDLIPKEELDALVADFPKPKQAREPVDLEAFWRALQVEAALRDTWTNEEVRVVIPKHFPQGWRAAYAAARAEAEALQHEVNEAAVRGDWLW